MNHVIVGAALPLLVCVVVYFVRGRRAGWRLLVLGPLAMLVSGVWAVVPDLPRLWGDLQWYNDLHHTRSSNLFWGHLWIDARASIDEWRFYPVIAIVLAALVVTAALRELRLAERAR